MKEIQERIWSIDVHAHFGLYDEHQSDLVNSFMTADPEGVLRLAELSHTERTIVSPLSGLFTSDPAGIIAANVEASEAAERHEGLLQWVVVNPQATETYAQAETMLDNPWCAGIKIHPEQHKYRIEDFGEQVFRFASAHQAIVQSHSGCPNSQPTDFVRFADDFPEVQLIISHLGNNWDGDMTAQVRAIQQCRHGNIFTDTSSAKSITPNLIEWAVREVGADKILYGTDSPLYFAPMQRARIDCASLDDTDKKMILRDNALRLFAAKLS